MITTRSRKEGVFLFLMGFLFACFLGVRLNPVALSPKQKDKHVSDVSPKPESLQPVTRQCVGESVWEGTWQLNEKLASKPGAKLAEPVDLAQRYHSNSESTCNMTDILKLSVDEVVRGHSNDEIERELVKRLNGIRGQTLLQMGTSVDHRNILVGCPLFGTKRRAKQAEGADIVVSMCTIPLIELTLVYIFNGPLTKEYVPITKQEEQLKAVDEALKAQEIDEPSYVVLSGIEWDMKWHKDKNETLDWEYTKEMAESKVSVFRQHYPNAPLFLRTQPFTEGMKFDSLAAKTDFEQYNDIFRGIVKQYDDEGTCAGVHIADMAKLMRMDGKARDGWSDGKHPSNWVILQYLNILLNVMASIGAHCRAPKS